MNAEMMVTVWVRYGYGADKAQLYFLVCFHYPIDEAARDYISIFLMINDCAEFPSVGLWK